MILAVKSCRTLCLNTRLIPCIEYFIQPHSSSTGQSHLLGLWNPTFIGIWPSSSVVEHCTGKAGGASSIPGFGRFIFILTTSPSGHLCAPLIPSPIESLKFESNYLASTESVPWRGPYFPVHCELHKVCLGYRFLFRLQLMNSANHGGPGPAIFTGLSSCNRYQSANIYLFTTFILLLCSHFSCIFR